MSKFGSVTAETVKMRREVPAIPDDLDWNTILKHVHDGVAWRPDRIYSLMPGGAGDADFKLATTAAVVKNLEELVFNPAFVEVESGRVFKWTNVLGDRMKRSGADLCGVKMLTVTGSDKATRSTVRCRVYHVNWRYFVIITTVDDPSGARDEDFVSIHYISVTARKAMEMKCSA